MTMQSFWNNDSDLQDIADQLVLMVPDMGPVEQPRKNKALERFRRASNCYYDLYNNGLCNRGPEFRRLFKVRVSDFYKYSYGLRGRYRDIDFDRIMPVVEPIMRNIVMAAAREQGIEA
jgi:hypothetical protein